VSSPPVLLVHGIWDSAARLEPLRRGLERRGLSRVQSFDLLPNSGRAPIAELGARLREQVDALARSEKVAKVDLVGFSMGALVSRWYLQRGGGKGRVRRFVSISGPHQGTLTALGVPLRGVRDMRPGSALLVDLASDPDPFGPVEVHCAYTPFDLMVVPARTAVLPGARSVRRFAVAMHRFMIRDEQVLDYVAGVLAGQE